MRVVAFHQTPRVRRNGAHECDFHATGNGLGQCIFGASFFPQPLPVPHGDEQVGLIKHDTSGFEIGAGFVRARTGHFKQGQAAGLFRSFQQAGKFAL